MTNAYYLGVELPKSSAFTGWADLDPGIKEFVTYLRLAGFETTDSGDGWSKHAAIFDGEALDYAHVFAVVAPGELVAEARRMRLVLQRSGADVEGLVVQGTYDPADGSAVLMATWPGSLRPVSAPQLGGHPTQADLDQVASRLVADEPGAPLGELLDAVMRHFGGKCNPKAASEAVRRAMRSL